MDRCSANFTQRVGNPGGICDEPAKPLQKLISGTLREATYSRTIPVAIQSPGYTALMSFTLSELQLNVIFKYLKTMRTPREAVCRWIVENMDYMNTFVPPSYPRVLQEKNRGVLETVAPILGAVAAVSVLFTGWTVHRNRRKRSIIVAQIEFLWLILAGLFIIAMAAIVVAMPTSDATCVASIWLINIGYTLELVPLIVKVAAVNQLIAAARRFRRVVVNRKFLFGAVFLISIVVAIYLILWSSIDPPGRNMEYELTSAKTNDGSTIVTVQYFCNSESIVWKCVAVGWNTLLLLCASILAFQMRNHGPAFSESRQLAFMIYSAFMFVVLRVTTYLLEGPVSQKLLSQLRSLIFSCDVITAIIIYFVPKLTSSNALEEFGGSSAFFDPSLRRSIQQINSTPPHRLSAPLRWISNISMISHPEADDTEGAIEAIPTPASKANSSGRGEKNNNDDDCTRQTKDSLDGSQQHACPHCGHPFLERKALIETSDDDEDGTPSGNLRSDVGRDEESSCDNVTITV